MFSGYLVLNGEHDYLLTILKICFKIIFLAHVSACVWHAVGYYNNSGETTWIDAIDLKSSAWVDRYWNSLFWAVSNIVSIGYQKVAPQNNFELFFGVMIVLFSAFVFGYALFSMQNIYNEISKEEIDFKF